MKRWIRRTDAKESIQSSQQTEHHPKLKRTLESGHSYQTSVTFNNVQEMNEWLKEDELYED